MSDCSTELKRMVPLIKVVAAAIVDSHEDINKVQQRYSHWAARKLKQLNRQSLKTGKRNVTLTVNRNTNTATLPPDFSIESFVGVMVDGKRIPLKLRPELVDSKNVEDIPCDDTKCPKCSQDTKICNDLTVTEDTVLVTVHDTVQEQTIIKKLYPDGSYYLETKIPVWDEGSQTVIFTTNKEFIASLSLKPCGCIDDTEENIATIKCCCYDVYCNYYAPCNTSCDINYGGYKIFEETGLIQFDKIGSFKKVYIEYQGFMPKKNGQYQVPEVAFETIVKWIQFMNVDGRMYIPNVEKRWRLDRYEIERKAMEKEMGRISLSQIIQAIGLTPKFDINTILCDPSESTATTTTTTTVADTSCDDTPVVCQPTAANSTAVFTPFSILVIAGNTVNDPVPGGNTYQNNKLKGALGISMIVVNNGTETKNGLEWVIDTTTGTLTRYQGDGVTPNNWQSGDVLAIPTFFKLI